MKIVYVVEDFAMCGGVERIVSEKANRFSDYYGHDVTIISVYKDERSVNYSLSSSIKTIFLNVPMAKKSGNTLIMTFNRIHTLFKAVRKLNNTIKAINPDVIFFTTTLGALLLPLCYTKAKKIYESHTARIFAPYNKLFFATEHSANTIICLTEGDSKNYKHAKEVKVIPNFIGEHGISVKDYSVHKSIAVGRLDYEKGFDILINIWKTIVEKHPDWQLHIYGEGPLKDELQKQIETCKLQGKVILCGKYNNIMEKYSEYSLHLMTSRYEGLPMVLIEAQSCGLPSVVFDFKYGASDIITDGYNGILIEQSNVEEFIKATNNIMDNKNLREQLGKKGIEMSSRFYAENIMPKWNEVLTNSHTYQ